MSDYRLMIDNNYDLELVDMSNPEVDLSSYSAEVASGWKKILKPNYRRAYRAGGINVYTGNAFAFTYSDRSVVISNPGEGDFIPPGYVNISSPISTYLMPSYLPDIVKRCTINPLRGLVLNRGLISRNGSFSAPRSDGSNSNRNFNNSIKCWEVTHNSPNRYGLTCTKDASGLYVNGPEYQVVISQVIRKFTCEGITEIKVDAPNALMVLLGSSVLTQTEEGHWIWEGEPLDSDVRLSVVVGNDPIPHIEVT